MATIRPVYRLRVKRPNGTTLAPISGAAHTDLFQVTTKRGGTTGGTGATTWKPYLGTITGRRGRFDRLQAHFEVGELRVRILDPRLNAAGGDNLTRWGTAFVGDVGGRSQYIGMTAVLELAFDDGRDLTLDASWAPYASGRITAVAAPEPLEQGPVLEFTVLDQRIEDFRKVFTVVPHSSLTYAHPARLYPMGLQDLGSQKGWGGFAATAAASGNIYSIDTTTTAWQPTARITVPPQFVANSGQKAAGLLRMSKALAAALDNRYFQWADGITDWPLRVKVSAGANSALFGISGNLHLDGNGQAPYDGGQSWWGVPAYLDGDGNLKDLCIRTLDGLAFPAWFTTGTTVTFEIFSYGPPTPDAPILIQDVHPAQLWKDILDAKLSDLNSDGSPAYASIPYNSASIAALIADTSFPNISLMVTGEQDLGKWVEAFLFQPHHFAGQIQGDGLVRGIDLRAPNSTAGLQTIDRTIYNRAEWTSGSDLRTAIAVKYPRYTLDTPSLDKLKSLASGDLWDGPVYMLARRQETDDFPTDLYGLLPVLNEDVDAETIPVLQLPQSGPQTFASTLASSLVQPNAALYKAVADPYKGLFGSSAAYLTLRCRRVTGTTDQLWPGTWCIANVEPPPNPATNVRGGARLMMVTERQEEDDGANVSFTLLDAGPTSQPTAAVPSLTGNVTAASRHFASAPIGLNAAGDLVELAFNITAQTVATQPTAGDVGWRSIPASTATAPRFGPLPSGMRVWVRVRSIEQQKLPSAWLYYPFCDMPTPPGPTGVTATVTGATVALSWTAPADTVETLPIMPYLDGSPFLAQPLPPGSTTFQFTNISGAHTFGVRAVDAYGGGSAIVTAGATGAAAHQLPVPRALQPLQGRGQATDPIPANPVAYGIELLFFPGDPAASSHLEAATDLAFTNLVYEAVLPAGAYDTVIPAPLTSGLVYIRVAHTRAGYTDSAWSDVASCYPTGLVASTGVPRFATGSADLSIDGTGKVWLELGTTDPLTDEAYYAVSTDGINYAAVTTSSLSVARTLLTPGTRVAVNDPATGTQLSQSASVLVTVRWANGVAGFGATDYLKCPALITAEVWGTIDVSFDSAGHAQAKIGRSGTLIQSFRYRTSDISEMDATAGAGAFTSADFSGTVLTVTVAVDLGLVLPGNTRWLYVEYFDAAGATGNRLDAEDWPAYRPTDKPVVQIVQTAAFGGAVGSTVLINLTDIKSRSGTLKVWTNLASTADASTAGTPDGTFACTAPATITSSSLAALTNIPTPFTGGKTIYAEFVAADGVSSGQIAFRLGASLAFINTGTGAIDPTVPMNGGGLIESTIDALWKAWQGAGLGGQAMAGQQRQLDGFGGAGTGTFLYGGQYYDSSGLTKLIDSQLSQAFSIKLDTTVTNSQNVAVDRLLAKALNSDPNTLDGVVNGTTYARTAATALNGSGQVDMTASGVINRYAANILRASGGAALSSILGNVLDTGNLASAMQILDTGSTLRPVENAYASQWKAWGSAGMGSTGPWEIDSREGRFGSPGGRAILAPWYNTTGTTQLLDPALQKVLALQLDSTVTENGGRAVNRLLAKALAGDTDSLDGTPEGTTYKRVSSAAVSAGNIDFSASGVINRYAANMLRASGGAALSAIIGNLADTGNLASAMAESGGRAVNRLLAKALTGDADTLDGLPEGTTYKRVNAGAVGGSGFLDFGGTAWQNRYSASLARSSTDATALSAIVQFLANTGHLGSSIQVSTGTAANRMLAKGLPGDSDSLDGVPNGVTYQRVQGVSGAQIGSSSIANGAINVSAMIAANTILGSHIFATTLAAIKADLGTIAAGLLQNASSSPTAAIRLNSGYTLPGTATTYIDLAATAGPVVSHNAFVLDSSGNGTFHGQVKIDNTGFGATYPTGLLFYDTSTKVQSWTSYTGTTWRGVNVNGSDGGGIFQFREAVAAPGTKELSIYPTLYLNTTFLQGNTQHTGSQLAFFGATLASKPTVTGSKGGNAALGSLMSALSLLGLVTDSTT